IAGRVAGPRAWVALVDPDAAAPLLLRRERCELVEHAAGLERAGALKELGLPVDRHGELLCQRGRGQRRRSVNTPGDRLAGREHVLPADRKGADKPTLALTSS